MRKSQRSSNRCDTNGSNGVTPGVRPCPPRDRLSVVLACSFPIHPWAMAVIAECKATAARRGVRVAIQK